MKKRILSFILVCALLCTMSIGASAATVSKTGKTYGGTIGSYDTSAQLYTYSDHVVAETWCEATFGVTFTTSVRLYYNGDNNPVRGAGQMTATAYRGTDILNNIRGESTHVIHAGSNWGIWECDLGANIW